LFGFSDERPDRAHVVPLYLPEAAAGAVAHLGNVETKFVSVETEDV
jgi:hypothetical protein